MTNVFHDHGRLEDGGEAALSFPNAAFSFCRPLPEPGQARSSSGHKLVYRGLYLRSDAGKSESVPACAVYFDDPLPFDYASERIGLTMANALGVGPELLESQGLRPLPRAAMGQSGELLPMLVEKDVGVSLHDALEGAPIPRFDGSADVYDTVLPGPETSEGARYAHKILFDVYAQVANLQRRKLFHRDIRTANIALRRYGDGPEGIRATLIDLGLLTRKPSDRVTCDHYYDRLFEGGLLARAPSPLEQDAGYLALVRAEVLGGVVAERLDDELLLAALRDPSSPFAYNGATALARMLTRRDLDREAELAGLPRAAQVYGGVSGRAALIAAEETQHGGYIDTYDKQRLLGDPIMILETTTITSLAHAIWENYTDHRRRDGLPVEYETFESQPADLQESNYDQARHLRDKVELLGYELVLGDDCPEAARVHGFTDAEIELLAQEEHDRWVEERERAGWSYAPGKKDVELKTSPYLVPWEELDEDIRDYDRAPMRELIPIVESAGLAVRR